MQLLPSCSGPGGVSASQCVHAHVSTHVPMLCPVCWCAACEPQHRLDAGRGSSNMVATDAQTHPAPGREGRVQGSVGVGGQGSGCLASLWSPNAPHLIPLPTLPGTVLLCVPWASGLWGALCRDLTEHPSHVCFLAVVGPQHGAHLLVGFRVGLGPQGDNVRRAWPACSQLGPQQALLGVCPRVARGPVQGGAASTAGSALTAALPQSWKPGPCGQRDIQTSGQTGGQLVAGRSR